jgi:hypothetical protein
MCELAKLTIILLITNMERYTLVMHGFLQGIGTVKIRLTCLLD